MKDATFVVFVQFTQSCRMTGTHGHRANANNMVGHLVQDAAKGPHVNCKAEVRLTKQYLWCTVVESLKTDTSSIEAKKQVQCVAH